MDDIFQAAKNTVVKADYYPYNKKLSDIIVSNKTYGTELALNWFYQIIDGIKYLHSNGFYPTLSSSDILISEDNELRIKETITPKLICQTLNVLDNNRATYTAPELLNNSKNNLLKENKLSSFFSIGIIGFELFNHYKPFSNVYEMCLYENRPEMLPQINSNIDENTQKLINNFLCITNRSKRIELIENKNVEFKKPIIQTIGSSIKASTKNDKLDEIITEYSNKKIIKINPVEVVGDKKNSNRNNFTANQYHIFVNLLSNQVKYSKPIEIEILSKLNSLQLQELYMKILNEKNNDLKKFTLSNNNLNFYSCNLLLLMLQRMPHLEEINLENNVINDDGCVYIISKLKDMKNLKVINMNGTALDKESVDELSKLNLPKLEKCVVSVVKDETIPNLLDEVKGMLKKVKGVEVRMIEEESIPKVGRKASKN